MNEHEIIDTVYQAVALGQGARFMAEFNDDNTITIFAADGTTFTLSVKKD